MIEINFSYIEDSENDRSIWPVLVGEFGSQYGVKVNLHSMTWDNAWGELFAYTSSNNPPHVSHVGNTWVSSLARLNGLRLFTPNDILGTGGSRAFIVPNWESGLSIEDQGIWAIPWTAWTFVICYRKNLLEQAGIDPASAFGTMKATVATIKRLSESSLEIPWLNPRLPNSYRDLLHIAASWIWASGGDFLDEKGERVLFNKPEALAGLRDLIATYRFVRPQHRGLTQADNFALFQQGHAAAALVNIRAANVFCQEPGELGIAPVTEVPWMGGGSLVIWQNSPGGLSQQRAAIDLVKFLASREINIRYWNEAHSLPSRLDALEQIYPAGHPNREAILYSAQKGHGYHIASVWRRIETQLSQSLGEAIIEATDNPSVDVDSILHKHIDSLARQFENMLDRN